MGPTFPDVDLVVIGASAGGLDALRRLLSALPADLAATVLIAQHRPAEDDLHLSMAMLLARECALPVEDAWDREPLRPGMVRLAPPDYHLLVDPGPVTALSKDQAVRWSRPALDPLFESAAWVLRRRLLGIVLTGASDDGAAGARTLRSQGGELWVQDPSDALVPTMPQAALSQAGADHILTLDAMCHALRGAGRRIQ